MRWFWANFDDATDQEVHEAVSRMHALMDGDNLNVTTAGTLADLESEDLETVDLAGNNPHKTTGLALFSVMDCTELHAERITTYPQQDELYPGVYTSYQRTYLGSRMDFTARATQALNWTIETAGTLLSSPFTMRYGGGDRRIPAQTGSAPVTDILINRSWLREPAHFQDSTRAMEQDYQVEVFYERTPGRMIHLWADWRQVRMGTLDNDDEVVLEVALSNMEDWDDQTSKLCRENRPPPDP